jgi:hypothetical protein
MADDLSRMWENFSLLEEEDEEVDVQANDFQEVTVRGRDCVVGKLVADRYVSKETIKTTLQGLWRSKGMSFKALGENLFIIEFEKSRDKKRVLDGRPWVFEGSLFLVEDYDARIPPGKITFDRASFWVRMFELPLGCMGREVGRKIGSTVGIVEEVDTEVDGVGWGEYLRVKISIDLAKPLSRGRKMKLEGKSDWVAFQYERLPKFCFQCGVICHGPEGCLKRTDLRNQGDKAQYGPWLRAPSPTRRADRNQGGFATKPGRFSPKPPAPDRRSRRGTSGIRRGEDRGRERRYTGDGEDDEGVFRESNEFSSKKEGNRDKGENLGVGKGEFNGKNQAQKASHYVTDSQPMGFHWVHSRKEDYVERGNMGKEINAKDLYTFKANTWKQEQIQNKTKEHNGKRAYAGKQGVHVSPIHSVGQKGSGDKRPFNGGVYSGPSLTEIEKNMKEAQANIKEAREIENEGATKAMVTWKRKEREWMEGSGEKKNDEAGGSGRDMDTPKKGRTTYAGSVLTDGSGLAEADFQPRRPQ